MIITKTIKMIVNGTMVKRYKEMGYDVKQYDIIELPVDKLSKFSHKKILCACDICGDEKEVKYNNYCGYISKNSNGIYTCKICNLEQRKKTCLEIYGVDNVSKNENVKKKVKKSMIENGTDFGFRSQSYKKTLMKNYGVTNPSMSKEIQLKKEETCFKNFGVINPFQSSIIKNKMGDTLMKKYGVRYPAQSYEIHRKQQSGYILKHHDNGLYYRGSYELDFIEYCILNEIEIENFKGTIDYFFDGKNRKYFPDFFIKKLNMVIEIKSSYTYDCEKEQNEAKKEATINNGFDFKFLINKNYKDL